MPCRATIFLQRGSLIMLSWWLGVSLVGSFRGLSVKRDDIVGYMASVWRITATRWLRVWQVRPKPSRTRIVVGQNNTGRNEAEEAGRDRSSRGCRPWRAGAFSGGSEFCTTASHQTVLSIQLRGVLSDAAAASGCRCSEANVLSVSRP